MLSGSATPMETMPVWLQGDAIFPTPHFVSFSQAVLYRAAGLDIVWPELLMMTIISAVYSRHLRRAFPPDARRPSMTR